MNKTLIAIFAGIGALIIIFGFLAYQNMHHTANIQVEENLKTPEKLSGTNLDTKNNPMENQDKPPKDILKPNIDYKAKLVTSEGEIIIDLHEGKTPITAGNFVYLANKEFYNNTIFHRVIEGFMIQGGDPKGDGTGGPGYKFDDEPFEGQYSRGTVAMANSGPNTNGSQFFIMHEDYPLPPNYVIFGNVIEGMEVVDKIATAEVEASPSGENSKPVNPVIVLSVEIIEEPKTE